MLSLSKYLLKIICAILFIIAFFIQFSAVTAYSFCGEKVNQSDLSGITMSTNIDDCNNKISFTQGDVTVIFESNSKRIWNNGYLLKGCVSGSPSMGWNMQINFEGDEDILSSWGIVSSGGTKNRIINNYWSNEKGEFMLCIATENPGKLPVSFVINKGYLQINNFPEANNDIVSFNNSEYIIIDVLKNDFDLDEDILNIVDITQATKGNAVVNGDIILYTPTTFNCGYDSFSYTVSDCKGGSDTANVYIGLDIKSNPALLVANNNFNRKL